MRFLSIKMKALAYVENRRCILSLRARSGTYDYSGYGQMRLGLDG